jgi:hypothetical protein
MRLIARALVASALVLGTTAAALDPAGATADHRGDDDRLRAAVTRHTPDYDFELILTDYSADEPGAPLTWVRRTDDVGSDTFEGVPDAHGYLQSSSWGVESGKNCLTSSGGEFGWFEDEVAHRGFTYGIAGRNVSKVTVVLEDGTRLRANVSRQRIDGFGGYMVERPLASAVDRIDGFNSRGRKVASIDLESPDNLFTDFGQDRTTCVPIPWD